MERTRHLGTEASNFPDAMSCRTRRIRTASVGWTAPLLLLACVSFASNISFAETLSPGRIMLSRRTIKSHVTGPIVERPVQGGDEWRLSLRSNALSVLTFATTDRNSVRSVLALSSDVNLPESLETSTEQSLTKNSTPNADLCLAYRIVQYSYLSIALLIMSMPDRTVKTMIATKWGGAAGFGLAAGLCRILESAAGHSSNNNNSSRLQSDTYQRLNLALLVFAGVGLTAIPGEAAFLSSRPATILLVSIMTLLKLMGSAVAWIGWRRGAVSPSLESTDVGTRSQGPMMLSSLAKGVQKSLQQFRVRDSKKALTYRNYLLLVMIGILSSFMEGLFHIRYRNEFTRTWFEISLQWSAVARLSMIATMIFTLKDAAERDRLTGTSFIELNLLVGSWAAVVGLGQTFYPLGFAVHRGVEMFAFAIPFFLKAYKSHKEKRSLESTP